MASRDVEISRVSPKTAFKIGLIMGLIGMVVWLIAVTIVYIGLDGAGIVDQVNSLIGGVGGDQGVGYGLVFSAAGLVGVIGTVMMAVLSPLIAVIYNAVADLLGGITVTLTDTNSPKKQKAKNA